MFSGGKHYCSDDAGLEASGSVTHAVPSPVVFANVAVVLFAMVGRSAV